MESQFLLTHHPPGLRSSCYYFTGERSRDTVAREDALRSSCRRALGCCQRWEKNIKGKIVPSGCEDRWAPVQEGAQETKTSFSSWHLQFSWPSGLRILLRISERKEENGIGLDPANPRATVSSTIMMQGLQRYFEFQTCKVMGAAGEGPSRHGAQAERLRQLHGRRPCSGMHCP